MGSWPLALEWSQICLGSGSLSATTARKGQMGARSLGAGSSRLVLGRGPLGLIGCELLVGVSWRCPDRTSGGTKQLGRSRGRGTAGAFEGPHAPRPCSLSYSCRFFCEYFGSVTCLRIAWKSSFTLCRFARFIANAGKPPPPSVRRS
jgi:hypothetical protein